MLEPTSYSVLLNLSTYPNFAPDKNFERIDKVFNSIKESRKRNLNVNAEYENYYSPIYYHCWGTWDMMTISLVDNSQMITRSLLSRLSDENVQGFLNSKTNSGLMFKEVGISASTFRSVIDGTTAKFNYMANVNFTISKKWLLPNGFILINKIVEKIKETLDETEFILIHSFSTYELSLVLFDSNIKNLHDTICEIRAWTGRKIDSKSLNLLYDHRGSKEDSNIFSDSNSIFGIRLEDSTPIIYDAKVKAYYEMEVRPSKIIELQKLIEGFEQNLLSKPGKYDLMLESTSAFDHSLINRLKKQGLSSKIRKVKTHLLFEVDTPKVVTSAILVDPKGKKNEAITETIKGNSHKFIDCKFDYLEINENLKTIKIAKSIRNQLLKMFYTIQNVFSDPISCSYFFDLYTFVLRIRDEIKKEAKLVKRIINSAEDIFNEEALESDLKVSEREEIYKNYLEIFEEVFFTRYVNDHSIDEVPDFLIRQPGGQLQGVATSYDNLAKYFKKNILGINSDYDNLVTSFDDTVLLINNFHLKISVNYLFEPANAIFILLKEIFNLYINNADYSSVLFDLQKLYVSNLNLFLEARIDQPIYFSKDQLERMKMDYVVNDYVRLRYYFNSDFKLFYYFHLSSILMSSGSYLSTGALRRGYVFREINRMMSLAITIGSSQKEIDENLNHIRNNPPIIEVRIDWEKYYDYLYEWITSEYFLGLKESVINLTDIFELKEIQPSLLDFDDINFGNYLSSDRLLDFSKFWCICLSLMKKVRVKETSTPAFFGRSWKTSSQMKKSGGKDDKGQESVLNECSIQNHHDSAYFLCDPQGGIFFIDFIQMNKYTIIRNKMLMLFLHMNSLYKTDIYREYSKKNNF